MSEPTAHDILLRGYVEGLTELTRLLLDAGCDVDRAADALLSGAVELLRKRYSAQATAARVTIISVDPLATLRRRRSSAATRPPFASRSICPAP